MRHGLDGAGAIPPQCQIPCLRPGGKMRIEQSGLYLYVPQGAPERNRTMFFAEQMGCFIHTFGWEFEAINSFPMGCTYPPCQFCPLFMLTN